MCPKYQIQIFYNIIIRIDLLFTFVIMIKRIYIKEEREAFPTIRKALSHLGLSYWTFMRNPLPSGKAVEYMGYSIYNVGRGRNNVKFIWTDGLEILWYGATVKAFAKAAGGNEKYLWKKLRKAYDEGESHIKYKWKDLFILNMNKVIDSYEDIEEQDFY